MLDTILLAEMTSGYSDEELQAIAKAFARSARRIISGTVFLKPVIEKSKAWMYIG